MNPQRCGICTSQQTKYKCPTCRTLSCSLPCFKQHESACAELRAQSSATLESTNSDTQVVERVETSTATPSIAPADLNDLFQKYPNLREQLRDVYKSTRSPSQNDENSRASNEHGISRRPWNPGKGFENGLASLNRILQDDTADSNGMEAFMKLLADKSTM